MEPWTKRLQGFERAGALVSGLVTLTSLLVLAVSLIQQNWLLLVLAAAVGFGALSLFLLATRPFPATRLEWEVARLLAVRRARTRIRSDEITAATRESRQDFFRPCTVVVSAPGTVFFAGEKAVVDRDPVEVDPVSHTSAKYPGATATCLRVPRRVYVGLRLTQDGPGLLVPGESVVLTGPPDRVPHERDRLHDTHDRLSAPLTAAAAAYEQLTGRPCPSAQVFVWSEWRGESGLGWSGAFAAALAGALLSQGCFIGDPQSWPRSAAELQAADDFQRTLSLAWCIEAVMHGGRASGSAPCGSMLRTRLPFFFRAPDVPRLWRVGPKADGTGFPLAVPEGYKALLAYRGYSFDYLVNEGGGSREEQVIAERMVEGRDIVVVDTTVLKSTPAAVKTEFTSTYQGDGEYEKLYFVLGYFCRLVENTMRAIGTSIESRTPEAEASVDAAFCHLAELMERAHHVISALGFGFGAADQILGWLRKQYGRTDSRCIGGKLSGAGTGGNLLIVARGSDRDLAEIPRLVRIIGQLVKGETSASVSTLYSARADGFESDGLRIEGF